MEIRLTKHEGWNTEVGTRWLARVITRDGWVRSEVWGLAREETTLAAFAYACALIPDEAEEWLSKATIETQDFWSVKR